MPQTVEVDDNSHPAERCPRWRRSNRLTGECFPRSETRTRERLRPCFRHSLRGRERDPSGKSRKGWVLTMVEPKWSKPGGALEVLGRVRLEPHAAALLAVGHSPARFVALLAERGHYPDAARF